MAYIFAKCPRSVFLVLRLTLLMAGTSLVTSLKVVSATAIRASYTVDTRENNDVCKAIRTQVISQQVREVPRVDKVGRWCALIRIFSVVVVRSDIGILRNIPQKLKELFGTRYQLLLRAPQRAVSHGLYSS